MLDDALKDHGIVASSYNIMVEAKENIKQNFLLINLFYLILTHMKKYHRVVDTLIIKHGEHMLYEFGFTMFITRS